MRRTNISRQENSRFQFGSHFVLAGLKHCLLISTILGISTLLSACAPSSADHANIPNIKKPTKASTDVRSRADFCLFGGTTYLGDSLTPSQSEIVIKNGLITQIQTTTPDVPSCQGYDEAATKIIDLTGSAIYPGFVDAHAHFVGIGLRELTLNLENTGSIKALKTTLKSVSETTPIGSVIFGRGWIETHWPENRFPTRQDLDAVAPDHIVILERADGHAFVVNSKALDAAKITQSTKPPFGGEILIGQDGHPSGMLIDKAQGLVGDLLPKMDMDRVKKAMIQASKVYAGYGWTGTHSMSFDGRGLDLLENLSDRDLVKIRVYPALDLEHASSIIDQIKTEGERHNANGRIRTRAIKVYMDGALGSRGAALLEPYQDDPKNSGLLLSQKEELMPLFKQALRHGIQISTHAIGDRANRMVLDWYAEAFSAVPVDHRKVKNPRWRIEHSQIINPTDIPRFGKLGVIASMQPSHAIGDLHFAPKRLGDERLVGGYAWASLLASGAKVIGGSDAPVERGDPRIEFYAAITRQDLSGYSAPNWQMYEKLTRKQALKLLTQWPAYGGFNEAKGGTIAVGKQADLTVFSQDIMTIPALDILKVKTILTMVDGKIAYQQK